MAAKATSNETDDGTTLTGCFTDSTDILAEKLRALELNLNKGMNWKRRGALLGSSLLFGSGIAAAILTANSTLDLSGTLSNETAYIIGGVVGAIGFGLMVYTLVLCFTGKGG